jgi:hypothetical protein
VAWHWYLIDANGNHIDNWGGFGNRIDSAGDQILATTGDDGTDAFATHFVLLFKVGTNGDTYSEFGDAGLSGANDDYALGIAQDSFNTTVFYMVGKTNSPDFNTTPGTFQPNYVGDPMHGYDGWIGSVTTTG